MRVAGLIPVLAQWVKDLAWPVWIQSLARELPYSMDVAIIIIMITILIVIIIKKRDSYPF